MEPFLGQIQAFAFAIVPHGWAKCDGQLLPIIHNQALFSLLGTTYGGDGRTTFGLPDLRAAITLHMGQSIHGTAIALGERSDLVIPKPSTPESTAVELPQATTSHITYVGLNFCIATIGLYPSPFS